MNIFNEKSFLKNCIMTQNVYFGCVLQDSSLHLLHSAAN